MGSSTSNTALLVVDYCFLRQVKVLVRPKKSRRKTKEARDVPSIPILFSMLNPHLQSYIILSHNIHYNHQSKAKL
eukprot:TRINITY_DN5735_c0_g1_i1.p1 TRINITY_DN5735_c0_g1~~TRINITY_DN5735_c0_g1_i1.p1  ORF type:complete len:75 (-),score=1.19 TRINITY_DN5735_c0_g1_i1:178-402(-)